MSFRKNKATKNIVETVRVKAGDFSLESWQYNDGVMFVGYINGHKQTSFVIGRSDADKLAKWILHGKRSR